MSKFRENRLLVSLLSALLFTTPPFENNPQSCGMIKVITKKKEEGSLSDEDVLPTAYQTKK